MFNYLFQKPDFEHRKQLYYRMQLLIFLLFFPSFFFAFFPGKITVVSFVCFSLISVIFFSGFSGMNFRDYDGGRAFGLLLIYNLVSFVRGLLIIENSVDFRVLISNDIFVLFLFPFFIFLADLDFLKRIWKILGTIGLLYCLFGYFFPPSEGTMTFNHNILYFGLFIIATPYIDRKYTIYFISIALLTMFYDMDRRSISLFFVAAIGTVLLFRIIRSVRLRRFIYVISIVIPLSLLSLGLTGTFNIFNYMGGMKVDIAVNGNRQYNVDSRTSIYKDVFGELVAQGKLLYGLGERGKTETSLVENPNADYWKIYKDGRTQTEAGMLNFFQYGGFIGFFVYSFFLLTCSYYALFSSNNRYIKLIGVFMCFKYVFSFIEEPLTINVNSFNHFICCGICLNKKFRHFSESKISNYLNSIFPRHQLVNFR